ncbi:MAG: FtsQ-type POTRA domain-containing protein [Selenomonadaceae bacterium]|nr:FtsQ-type POTRA domain-containing protein [Selenomonadaceae bacterium]
MKRSVRPGIIYLLIAFIILLIFIYAPIFVLREIRADGMRFMTNEDIVRICNIPYGTPLFSIETDEISKRLLNDLRIEEAVVRRSLPCYLDISVKERLPVATIAAENCYFAVDKGGKIIDAYTAPKFSEVPNIKGIYLKDAFIGDEVQNDVAKKILAFLDMLDDNSVKTIKELELTDSGEIWGETMMGIKLRLGDLSEMEVKAKLTMNFLEDIKKNPMPLEYADFYFNVPFVKLKEEVNAEEVKE